MYYIIRKPGARVGMPGCQSEEIWCSSRDAGVELHVCARAVLFTSAFRVLFETSVYHPVALLKHPRRQLPLFSQGRNKLSCGLREASIPLSLAKILQWPLTESRNAQSITVALKWVRRVIYCSTPNAVRGGREPGGSHLDPALGRQR